jgi:hypothetical protein
MESEVSRVEKATILFIVVALLLLLATFGQGGYVGEKVIQLSTYLFGLGFYLIPIIYLH